MLRELLALLRGTDSLRQMHEKLIEMIEKSQRMFEAAWEQATADHVQPDVRDEILRIDTEVNKAERFIRRRLAEHIVAQPKADIPACLALMSVVKDAERLGDYSKDILDAAAMESQLLSQWARFEEFQSVYQDTRSLFDKLRQALAESDSSLGQDVMLAEREIAKRCDTLLECLVSNEDACRVGIPWALIVRYVRRTAGHLSNVASSLVMPLHKLDYHNEAWFKESADTA